MTKSTAGISLSETPPPHRRRSQSRMLALQSLCVLEAVGDSFLDRLPSFLCDERILTDLQIESPAAPELTQFAGRLARGAWSRRAELDGLLESALIRWSLPRITPVDRNILRLGLYELIAPDDSPSQVVINEAIELAKRFGDTDSPSFINGVLDAVRRDKLRTDTTNEPAPAADEAAPGETPGGDEASHGPV